MHFICIYLHIKPSCQSPGGRAVHKVVTTADPGDQSQVLMSPQPGPGTVPGFRGQSTHLVGDVSLTSVLPYWCLPSPSSLSLVGSSKLQHLHLQTWVRIGTWGGGGFLEAGRTTPTQLKVMLSSLLDVLSDVVQGCPSKEQHHQEQRHHSWNLEGTWDAPLPSIHSARSQCIAGQRGKLLTTFRVLFFLIVSLEQKHWKI